MTEFNLSKKRDELRRDLIPFLADTKLINAIILTIEKQDKEFIRLVEGIFGMSDYKEQIEELHKLAGDKLI